MTISHISDADLSRLLEGDVSQEEQDALQEHLRSCPECTARWERISAGARYVESLLFEAVRRGRTSDSCLSEDLLVGFINQTLDSEKRSMVEQHLAQCARCRDALAEKFTEAYAKEGDKWWSEYVAHQLLSLLVLLPPEELYQMLSELGIPAPTIAFVSEQSIQLPVLSPESSRMSPVDGYGFAQQTIPAYPQTIQHGNCD